MPPKGKGAAKSQKGQEKAAQKAKQKVAEDKTFGLKNKNKSKQVQKVVQAVQKSAVQQPKRAGPTPAEQKKAKQAEEEARQRELNMLFRVAPDQKKKEAEEKAAAEKAAAEAAAAGDAYSHLKPGEDYLWTADDFDAVETDDSRIEEALQKELEQLRERLEKEGGGTKVNPESFAIWKEKQRKLKEEAAKKNKAKMIKTGQFTGRALFEHNKDLFVDDEDADEEIEREVIPDDEEEEAAGGAIDSTLFDDDLEVEDAEDDEE